MAGDGLVGRSQESESEYGMQRMQRRNQQSNGEKKAMIPGESKREWKVGLSEQLGKLGTAYNLLVEVRFETAELVRQRRGTPDEPAYAAFQECVEKAMGLLVEARRKVGTYCG
jgi:hypothetical protein